MRGARADPTWHCVFKRLAVAARFFENVEIRTAMSDRIIAIVLTVVGRAVEFSPALKQRTIDFAGTAAAFSHPPADKVQNAQHLLRVHSRVGDRQHPSSRYSADKNAAGGDIRALLQGVDRRLDVIQRPIGTWQRSTRIAGIATRPIGRRLNIMIRFA
jgi:hypothetical protein